MTFEFNTITFLLTLGFIAALMGAVQGTCAYLILAERKISAWAQDRVGPNRVGREFGLPFGLLQPIADGVKFLIKEQVIPGHVDKLFYLIAPMIAVGTATLAIAVVPFGHTTPAPQLLDRRPDAVIAESRPFSAADAAATLKAHPPLTTPRGAVWPNTVSEMEWVKAYDEAHALSAGGKTFAEQVAAYNNTRTANPLDMATFPQFVIAPGLDIGVVFVFAIGSLAAYAIVLGGWSSNNKYSMLGALRSSAQLISYEIPMGMSVIGVFLVSGSLNVERIIDFQITNGWNVLYQPVACLLFTTAIFAECNRVPFDLPECEQELVGGYHTEYSGMKFALFFLGEYTHMVTTSFLCIALFFGGWHLPGVTNYSGDVTLTEVVLRLAVLAGKMIAFCVFYIFIRWTLPRFRFDQLMGLAWKVMIPLSLLGMLAVLVVKHYALPTYWMPVMSFGILIAVTLVSLNMPKPPSKAKLIVKGHPVTGERVLVSN